MSRKRGGYSLLLLGLVVAVGVAFQVFRQAQQAAETVRMESVEVLVAAQDIPERTVVAAPFLTVKRMLPTSLPPTAITSPDQVLGKMTVGPILAGEFILPGKLVESDGRAGLTYAVPKGKVVITVPASDILATGAIRVGDTVDLLVTIKPERQTAPAASAAAKPGDPVPTPTAGPEVDSATTQMTMQNLKVLGIGQVAAQPADAEKAKENDPRLSPAATITFAVDRQDALTIKALKDNDRVKMEMVLRAAGDDALGQTDPVTLRTIVDRYRFRAAPTPAAVTAARPPL